MSSTTTHEEELSATEATTQMPSPREAETGEFEFEPTIVRGRE